MRNEAFLCLLKKWISHDAADKYDRPTVDSPTVVHIRLTLLLANSHTIRLPGNINPEEQIIPVSEGLLARRPVWVLYNRVPEREGTR
jgi:hypothetical protein